jgi:hypothetical protein
MWAKSLYKNIFGISIKTKMQKLISKVELLQDVVNDLYYEGVRYDLPNVDDYKT